MRKIMPKDKFEEGHLCLTLGSMSDPENLVRTLVKFGYDRVYSVETKGEVSLRGGILDVFPPYL